MKKILFFITLISLYNFTFASIEEDECFNQLDKQIRNDARFNTKLTDWLKGVLLDETRNTKVDLNTYNKFKQQRVENTDPHKELYYAWYDKYDFLARRTNIATIVTWWNFVTSQWVWFGQDSSFTFPLPQKTNPQLWDKWVKTFSDPFKEFVLYTHHNLKWEFMSCWILKVVPTWKNSRWLNRSFWEISESWYFTNTLNWIESQPKLSNRKCNSWFEWEKISTGSLDFYKMKTDVCVINYSEDDYLAMQLISISYDNKSTYINDYVAMPLQVRAMKDLWTNPIWWLSGIRNKYLEYLDEKTCLSLIHKNIWDLPSFCNWTYSSQVNLEWLYSLNKWNSINTFSELYSQILDIFSLNKVNASRELSTPNEMIEKSKWMVVFENFPYDLYKKITDLKDEDFKSYLLTSINDKFEDLVTYKVKNKQLLTPYEEIFYKCNINYSKRVEIVKDLVSKYSDLNKIDYKKISYIDPNFWNCIIPYPDKKNLNNEIELSFPSNKILAKQINWTYIPEEIKPEDKLRVEKIMKLELQYNEDLKNITNKFNSWLINENEYNKQISLIKEKFNKNINNLHSNNSKIDSVNNNNLPTYIFWFLVFLGFAIVIYSIYFRRNKKQK